MGLDKSEMERHQKGGKSPPHDTQPFQSGNHRHLQKVIELEGKISSHLVQPGNGLRREQDGVSFS